MATTGYVIHANADSRSDEGRNKLFYHNGKWWVVQADTVDADQKVWKSDGTTPGSPGDTGGLG